MARQLGISRNTVVTAYEVLADEELIATRRGSGTRVLALRPVPLNPHRLLRDAHYPSSTVRFHDSDGNIICLQR
jgi:DNA-binding GntR family transcriptional regulator